MAAEIIDWIKSMHTELFKRTPEFSTGVRYQYCARELVCIYAADSWLQQIQKGCRIEYVKQIDAV